MKKNSRHSFNLISGLCLGAILFYIPACSSRPVQDLTNTSARNQQESENQDGKSYLVRDSSLHKRPMWLDNLSDWLKYEIVNSDSVSDKYFTYESGPKINRTEACDIAKSNVRFDVAQVISSLISKGIIDEAMKDKSNSNEELLHDQSELKDFLDYKLAEKIQPQLKGTFLVKSYWEYREYKTDLGAQENFKAYTCGVLVRVANDNLKKAIIFGEAQIRSYAYFLKYKVDIQNILQQNEKNSLTSLGVK